MKKNLLVSMIMVITIVLSSTYGMAKSTDIRGGTMTPGFKTRPDLGIQKGAFLIFPQLTAGMEYNDNIYATKNNKESDQIITLTPRILTASTWSRHSVKLDAGTDFGFYMDKSNEDYMDTHIFADGRLDIVDDSYFDAKAGYENYYEDRGSPDALGAWDEPATYDRYSGSGILHHGMGRSFVQAGGQASAYRYDDVDIKDGGSQNLDYRNYDVYGANARFGYESMPGVVPFVEGRYEWREYDKQNLSNRNSEGYRIGAGTQIDFTGVTRGEVYGGYLTQQYDEDDLYDDISGAWYGLSLLWEATPLTSVQAGVERQVDETTQIGASGILATTVSLNINHELLRELSLDLNLGYENDNYGGVDIEDDYYRIGPGLTYFINRNFNASLRYVFTTRDSSEFESLREYDVNKLSFTITGSL